ncbi:hypothetical protein [Bradyrhizobium sp.]|uniref:hypothetical protein n=1 Tax=Bradyrhizobium sp. TaxID=376 RepID=UPI002DFB456A|nr:hypothetical protein [Bradyrhizobium sp.]
MTAESAATRSGDSAERKSVEPGTGLHQTGTGGKYPVTGTSGFGELVGVILDNLKLLVVGPVIAALVAFAAASVLPKWYTSVAYLAVDETGARVADARMRSVPVLDKVLAEFHAPGDTLEARRRYLDRNLRMVVAAGETQKTSGLFRLEYSDRDPRLAKKVTSLFIDAWLASTQPRPDRRAELEAEIERTDLQTTSVTQLIDRLQKDSSSLISQSPQGELATTILGLTAKRDQNLANLITLRGLLKGVSRDVLFGLPDLPEEPSWPNWKIVVPVTYFVTVLLLLMFVILRHFSAGRVLVPSSSPKGFFRPSARKRTGE